MKSSTHPEAPVSPASAKTEDRLRLLRQALDAAQLGTWTWNLASDLISFDERAAQLFSVEPGRPILRTALRDLIVVPDDKEAAAAALKQSIETGSRYVAEYRVHAADGAENWLLTSGLPTFAEDADETPANIVGMIGTVQDVTLRKTQEATLRQSEKLAATGRLAATIAHEINNPLEAVTNLIYLCKTDPTVPSPIQQLLETADSELARVAQIAQQTLGFYRDTTRPVDVDLNELLSGVVDLFQRKLEFKKLTCTLDLAPELRLFGLQGEIRQVFSNLLVNAIDASSNCRIHIRARRRKCRDTDGVAIMVADRGSGIPHHVRNRLFTPFFTTKDSVGTGLGLWVTKGIVEKQGGVVVFKTRTEHTTGTVFRVFLPLKIANPALFASPQSRFLQ